MRKRLTFQEAANLNSFAQAPARLPHHADVNGNPVYKQFMSLTQIYEEDEVYKRNADLRNLGARLGDERLGPGFRAPPYTDGPPQPLPRPTRPLGAARSPRRCCGSTLRRTANCVTR